MRRSTLLPAGLALLLLFAQSVAMLHVFAHLTETGTSSSQPDKQLPHSTACEQCLAAAALGAGVPAAALVFQTSVTDPCIAASPHASFRSGTVPAYTSRAPPRFV
jgi:hypothetical protein